MRTFFIILASITLFYCATTTAAAQKPTRTPRNTATPKETRTPKPTRTPGPHADIWEGLKTQQFTLTFYAYFCATIIIVGGIALLINPRRK